MSIFHYDFYRLSDPGILADQLAESLSDDKAVVVVEWADIVKDVLPRDHISINLEPVAAEPDERAITFTYPEDLQTLIANIETLWQELKP